MGEGGAGGGVGVDWTVTTTESIRNAFRADLSVWGRFVLPAGRVRVTAEGKGIDGGTDHGSYGRRRSLTTGCRSERRRSRSPPRGEQARCRVEIGVEALFGGHVHELRHAGDRRVVAVGARLQQLVEFGVGGVGQAGRGDLVES